MGLDDIVDKAKDAADAVKDKAADAAEAVKDKAGEARDAADAAVHSERAEKISDAVLDGGEKAANFVTGGKFEDEIGVKRDALDARIGDDEARAADKSKGGSGA
ncbi:MAG TPA: antitoxin [Pseudolysinimonas sp.]|nr:antitoxin [Pseudolysinimonas sp.]